MQVKKVKIIVGSTNLSKIGAVQEFFKKYFEKFEICAFETDSGVRNIPIDEETVQGALNRLSNIKQQGDIKVALEGGFMELDNKAWVQDIVAVNWEGVTKLGFGHLFQIPESAFKCAKSGMALNQVIIAIENAQKESTEYKQNLAVAGYITNGKYNRTQTQITALENFLASFNGQKTKPVFHALQQDNSIISLEKFHKLETACNEILSVNTKARG